MNRVMRASAIYGLANLGIRGLNFLLLPVYTHYLSPVDYGMIALAETLAMFMLQVINMGFDASIQRLYFQHVDPAEELSSYVGSALRFAFAMEATFLVLVFTVGPWLQRFALATCSRPVSIPWDGDRDSGSHPIFYLSPRSVSGGATAQSISHCLHFYCSA